MSGQERRGLKNALEILNRIDDDRKGKHPFNQHTPVVRETEEKPKSCSLLLLMPFLTTGAILGAVELWKHF